jgi:hypothetical protein
MAKIKTAPPYQIESHEFGLNSNVYTAVRAANSVRLYTRAWLVGINRDDAIAIALELFVTPEDLMLAKLSKEAKTKQSLERNKQNES